MTEPIPPASREATVGAPSPVLFRAFQEQQARRRRWAWLLVLPLTGVGVWALAKETAKIQRVVTPTGIRGLEAGMSQSEVIGVLGKPFSTERSADGRADCFQYGRPTLEKAEFSVYKVCYEDGKMRDVSVRRYASWRIGPNGTLLPPEAAAEPAPAGDAAKPAEPTPGAGSSAPAQAAEPAEPPSK